METYYDSPHLTIQWDQEFKFVSIQWRGFNQSNVFRDGMNTTLNFIIEKKSTKLLVDLREHHTLDASDQAWMASDWIPRSIAQGLVKGAIVLPKSALAQLSVRQIRNQVTNLSPVAQYFPTLEDARSWLLA